MPARCPLQDARLNTFCWTRQSTPKKARFLKAYAITCQITKAAEVAGIDRGTHTTGGKIRSTKPSLRQPRQRRPTCWKTRRYGAPITASRNQSRWPASGKSSTNTATLLIFLLTGARPQKYRDSVRQEVTGADGAPLVPPQGGDSASADCGSTPRVRPMDVQGLDDIKPEDLAKVSSILTGGEFTPDEVLSHCSRPAGRC